VEAYLQSTAADIVRKVAGRAGIQAGTIDAKGPVLQHVAQDGISDWDFLHRLAVDGREHGPERLVPSDDIS
jgi:phage protein D